MTAPFAFAGAEFGSRRLFPDLRARAYLAHAAISPPSLPVMAAAQEVCAGFAREGIPGIVAAKAQAELARERFASLIGTAPAHIARVGNTSAGVIAVAQGLRWRAGQRLLVIEGEFPTNVAPWLEVARERQLEVCSVPLELFMGDHAAGLERIEQELRRGLRLLAVSAVQFANGLRMPLEALGALCQRYGCLFFVDAIQAVGATPLQVEELGIDFLACGAHKWLMGILGAGFLYVRPTAQAELDPRGIGWMSLRDPERFLFADQGPVPFGAPLGSGPAVLEPGSLPFAALAAVAAGMGLLLALGVPAIHAHVNGYIDRIEPHFLARGFRSLRAPGASGRSTILSLVPPAGVPLARVLSLLTDAGIVATAPAGMLRLAPHWPNAAGAEADLIQASLARL
jgi:cysteine desulfurase / selenocysteine lyase